MKQIKLWLATIVVLLCSGTVNAYDFEVDGIYYLIKSPQTVAVTYKYHEERLTAEGDIEHTYHSDYSGDVIIPLQINGYEVTFIDDYAFNNCNEVSTITIPESVTEIGMSAFDGCSGELTVNCNIPYGSFRNGKFTKVTIGESVTSISSAFLGCSSLTSIMVNANNSVYDSRNSCNAIIKTNSNILIAGCSSTVIPESVTSIGDDAFYGCSSLTAITLPEGVTSIGGHAFCNCSNLTSINIPESVTSIERGAFYGCSSIATITIPKSVTEIGMSAFDGCSGELIVNCNIPSGWNDISGAFYNSKFTKVTIGEGVTSIGDHAFCDCRSLTSVNIPEGVTSIERGAFRGCSSLSSITIPEGVTSIGSSAFNGCSSLTAINIPESVTSIGSSAFSGCSSLTAINIPESVTSIGSSAFSGCSSLTAINIPESVTSIGSSAFSGCSSLTSIYIPEGVTSIENSTFKGCSSLSSITILKSVTSIGSDAFRNCNNLFEVINFSDLDIRKGSSNHGYVAYYAEKVIKVNEQIGDYYFYTAEDNTHYLQHYIGKDTVIVLPEDCNGDDYQIGETAFLNNDSITSVEIPQTVGTIGKSAFAGCDNLTAVSLARGVMTIEDNAFENCVSLTSIVIPLNMTTIGNSAFAGCSSLASVEFKEGIDTIGNNAFENCTSLTALSFPESLTAIGEKAFSGCSALSSLSCSANIETYGEGAFEGCTAVETLAVMGSVMPTVPSDKLISITLFSPMPLETTEFANKVYRNATVYVPKGSLERYQAADVWKNFWTIKEFDSTGIEDVTMDVSDAPIYNMKGERMACSRKELQKGIYIQNGKKFVVK